jgi:hypothetical protein
LFVEEMIDAKSCADSNGKKHKAGTIISQNNFPDPEQERIDQNDSEDPTKE